MSALTLLKNSITISNFKETMHRFYLPMLFATCGALIAILALFEIVPENEMVIKLVCALGVAYSAIIALKLYSESHQWQNNKYLLWSNVLLIAISAIVFIEPSSMSVFMGYGFGLLITVAPFIKKDVDEANYCNFNAILLRNSLFASTVMAIILCIGIASALLSVSYLFNINIGYKVYVSLAIIYFVIIAQFYILSNIPKDFSSTEQMPFPRSIKFIVSYILLPLVLVYLAILYAYIFRIITIGELPQNSLSYIILCFGMVGIFTHFFTRSLYENSGSILKLFHNSFYYLLLIPIVLLFVCIAIRIQQYGITNDRYFALLITIWLAASAIYIILTQAKNLRILAIIASTLLILASLGPESFGPLGANAISGASQTKQLQSLLIRENILQGGKIVKAQANSISANSQNRMVNIITYLEKIKQADRIRKWFPNDNKLSNKDYRSYQDIASDLIMPTPELYSPARPQLPTSETPGENLDQNSQIIKYFAPANGNNVDDIQDYDYVVNFLSASSTDFETALNQDGSIKLTAHVISPGQLVIIMANDKSLVAEFDLNQLAQHLKVFNSQVKDFTIEQNNDKTRVKLFVSGIIIDYSNPQFVSYRVRCTLSVKKLN